MPIDFDKLIEALMMAKAVSAVAVSEARAGCHIEVDVEGCEYRREGHRIVVKGKALRGRAEAVAYEPMALFRGSEAGEAMVSSYSAVTIYGNVEITASVEVKQEATQR